MTIFDEAAVLLSGSCALTCYDEPDEHRDYHDLSWSRLLKNMA